LRNDNDKSALGDVSWPFSIRLTLEAPAVPLATTNESVGLSMPSSADEEELPDEDDPLDDPEEDPELPDPLVDPEPYV